MSRAKQITGGVLVTQVRGGLRQETDFLSGEAVGTKDYATKLAQSGRYVAVSVRFYTYSPAKKSGGRHGVEVVDMLAAVAPKKPARRKLAA